MKFAYGKKQKVDSVDLDKLFIDLQGILQKHPLVPPANVDAIISEWINDLLFVAGKITEDELQEAMKAFESEGAVEAVNDKEDDEEDEDEE